MYRVIRSFADITDQTVEEPSGHIYHVGDKYPRGEATPDRIRELISGDNMAGEVFIELLDKEDSEKAIDSIELEAIENHNEPSAPANKSKRTKRKKTGVSEEHDEPND